MPSAVHMPAWQQLQTARNTLVEQQTTIHQQFESDPLRFDRFSVKTPELVFDYSKNLLTADIQQLLFDLADQCQLPVAIDRMFTGRFDDSNRKLAELAGAYLDLTDYGIALRAVPRDDQPATASRTKRTGTG